MIKFGYFRKIYFLVVFLLLFTGTLVNASSIRTILSPKILQTLQENNTVKYRLYVRKMAGQYVE